MSSTTRGPSGPSSAIADLGVPDLRERILRLRDLVGDSAEMAAVLAELETTYERLRVAAAEIHAQEEEIQRLQASQQLMRWHQQRVQQMLPVAMVTTDTSGLVTSANAAAVGLFGVEVVQPVRADLFAFLSPEDRGPLRAALARLVDGARLRRAASVVTRDGRSAPVEVSAATGSLDAREISWVFVVSTDTAEPADQIAVSEALVRLAALPAASHDDLGLLRAAVEICREALGDGIALSLHAGPPAAPSGLASSSSTAQQVDGAQVAAEDGPSSQAFRTRQTVVSESLGTDERWSRLAADPRVPDVGAIAVPLVVGEDALGVLSVYVQAGSPSPSRIVRSVEMLGAAAAAVLHEAAVRRQLQQESAELETALQSRSTIDQAKGIVMAQRACTAHEAFEHLVELSSTQHVKLRDVARILVERASGGAEAM